MFGCALTSLIVAVGAAFFGYCGLPDATAATIAQHIFLIAIGLFVICAVAAILDLELPYLRLVLMIRGGKVDPKLPS